MFTSQNTNPQFQHPDEVRRVRHYTVRELVGGHRGKSGLIAAGGYVPGVNTCKFYACRFVCCFAHGLDSFQGRCAEHPNTVAAVATMEEGNG